ncbi:hypothetical protein [Burkholderia multivorans]|uniref:hypothetical protein n=1 Tax=Burkholderia multivorans TaxID=87883 RepID=UPI001C224116|nr:hypothetical protein [Burkholderia multivorans]MBU9210090.1 hypothetical protein [Burkholderia multivorans]MCO1460196.1 hypothetical protein [Burkholderia multivorans]UQN69688.1 hypothetical protein L0Z45_01905 [Burkholderia multivorans]UQN75415.1 hypothetical protein L0Z11_01880 [Burkholderia multivorans]
MTTSPTQYARRIPPTQSTVLKTRVEARLLDQLQIAQGFPELLIKDTRKPSSSLLVRRALAVYLSALLRMTPEQLKREGLELHKLA